jgi:hypothetical protein
VQNNNSMQMQCLIGGRAASGGHRLGTVRSGSSGGGGGSSAGRRSVAAAAGGRTTRRTAAPAIQEVRGSALLPMGQVAKLHLTLHTPAACTSWPPRTPPPGPSPATTTETAARPGQALLRCVIRPRPPHRPRRGAAATRCVPFPHACDSYLQLLYLPCPALQLSTTRSPGTQPNTRRPIKARHGAS